MATKLHKKKISASAIFYNAVAYGVNSEGRIDYAEVEKIALAEKPKLLIVGASAYPRDFDYREFRRIADSVGAVLMCDMAHISGLVATQECNDPFRYCDVVTTTTHKSLRGPRAGVIFFRRGTKYDIDDKPVEGQSYDLEANINFAVFPSLQGGPHEHQIAAIAVAMHEAQQPEFKEYVRQLKANAVTLCNTLTELGHKIMTGGTDNHLLLWDLRPMDLTGSKIEKACDLVHITVNKNMIAGDSSALTPGGVRLGAPALTSRGFKEADFVRVAQILDKLVKICLAVQQKSGKKLADFVAGLESCEDLASVRAEVEELSSRFGLPGF